MMNTEALLSIIVIFLNVVVWSLVVKKMNLETEIKEIVDEKSSNSKWYEVKTEYKSKIGRLKQMLITMERDFYY